MQYERSDRLAYNSHKDSYIKLSLPLRSGPSSLPLFHVYMHISCANHKAGTRAISTGKNGGATVISLLPSYLLPCTT